MPAYVETINHFLAIGIIILELLVLVIAFNLIFVRSRTNNVLLFFKEFTYWGVFLTALGSVALSLFYSVVVGFPPCELCWMQRVFIYPQVVLFAIALYKHDRSVVDYALALSIIGTLISIYHVYIENGGTSSLACAIEGRAQVSCVTTWVFEFGYITIPVMALSAGLFMVILLLNYKYMTKNTKNI
jgi:disulfide bond formation protein DsbB